MWPRRDESVLPDESMNLSPSMADESDRKKGGRKVLPTEEVAFGGRAEERGVRPSNGSAAANTITGI